MLRIEFHFVIVVAELSQAKNCPLPPFLLSHECHLSLSNVFTFKYVVLPNISLVPQK